MKIVTHDGNYHADEVFATAILLSIYPQAEVIRTRDEETIQKADIVIDVGYEYDHEKKRYDHHQAQGAGERENGIPYSACGLVWKHYAEQLAGSKETAQAIDEKLIQNIDAIDNGIAYPPNEHDNKPYTITAVIESLKPVYDEGHSPQEAFEEAVQLAKRILRREIIIAQAQEKAAKIVKQRLEEQQDKQYLILEEHLPWKKTVIEESDKLFVVFQKSDGGWAISTVPVERGNFKARKDLPEAWAGLQGEALVEASGIQGAQFCHRGRFLAVAQTKEAAIALVEQALQE